MTSDRVHYGLVFGSAHESMFFRSLRSQQVSEIATKILTEGCIFHSVCQEKRCLTIRTE